MPVRTTESLEHIAQAQTDLTNVLSVRRGAPPSTRRVLPHRQLDQFPPPEMAGELAERCLSLPFVRSGESRMAAPGSRALSLPDICCAGPPEAFIDNHEFCHLHPPPESCLHLTLPEDLRNLAVRLGWAELHAV